MYNNRNKKPPSNLKLSKDYHKVHLFHPRRHLKKKIVHYKKHFDLSPKESTCSDWSFWRFVDGMCTRVCMCLCLMVEYPMTLYSPWKPRWVGCVYTLCSLVIPFYIQSYLYCSSSFAILSGLFFISIFLFIYIFLCFSPWFSSPYSPCLTSFVLFLPLPPSISISFLPCPFHCFCSPFCPFQYLPYRLFLSLSQFPQPPFFLFSKLFYPFSLSLCFTLPLPLYARLLDILLFSTLSSSSYQLHALSFFLHCDLPTTLNLLSV